MCDNEGVASQTLERGIKFWGKRVCLEATAKDRKWRCGHDNAANIEYV